MARTMTLYTPDFDLLYLIAKDDTRLLFMDVPREHEQRGTASRLLRAGLIDKWRAGPLGSYGVTDLGRAALFAYDGEESFVVIVGSDNRLPRRGRRTKTEATDQ